MNQGTAPESSPSSSRSYRALAALLSAALLVAPLGCGSSGGKAGPSDAGTAPDGVSPDAMVPAPFATRAAADLFAWPNVPVFDFTLPADRWAHLQAHALDEQYEPAVATFEGMDAGASVGLRFKGSVGTLKNCFDSSGRQICPKLSMKVDFAQYVPGTRFFGLKRINLHAMMNDDTKLRERLAYDLYRAMNVVAPRSAWAVLRVNGQSLGLFSMVEDIDGRFTDDRFPAGGNGNLFKEVWPASADPSYYAAGLQDNQETANEDPFVAFHAALAGAVGPEAQVAALGAYTDPDYLARYMAVDDALFNADGVTAIYCSDADNSHCGNHNYFWYQDDGRSFFTLIPWDLDFTFHADATFGLVPHWASAATDCTARYPVWSGSVSVLAPACDPVFQAMAARPDTYHAAVQQLLDGPFSAAQIDDAIQRHGAFIAAAVVADPFLSGAASWQASVVNMNGDIGLLRQRLALFQNGGDIIPLVFSATGLNDFEQVNDLGARFGVSAIPNPQSTVALSLNHTAALQGAQDLRVDFEYRNEPPPNGAYQQWSYLTIGFTGGLQDLTQRTGLRMLIRTDKARSVRIELDSPDYVARNQGIRFGWYVDASAQPTLVDVPFSTLALPSWAAPTTDVVSEILSRTSGLGLQAFVIGNDASGYLATGMNDPGFLETDAIEVY